MTTEMLQRQRVRVRKDGKVITLQGRFRVEVDREAGTVVLFDNRQNEVQRLEGVTEWTDGPRQALVAAADGEAWTLETKRCSCGG